MKVFKERFWRVSFSVLVLLLHVGVVDALAQAQNLPERAVLETVGKLWDKRHPGSPFPRISKALDVSQDDRAKRQTGRSAQQVAASSLASSLTSLVDRPSATDFLSIALDSGIFSREEEENLVTFTTSLYGVGSFFNPSMTSSLKEFQDSAYLRRVSIAISTGQADESMMGIMNDDRLNIASFVVKHQFGTRDVRDKHFDNEYKQFEEANRIWSEAISTLLLSPAVVKLVVDIQAGELSPDDIETQFQTQDELKKVYEKFENKLANFANLQGKLDEIAKRAERKWLGSVSFGGKFMEDKPKRYSVQGAVRGYAGSVDVTLNGEFSWTEKGVMGDREVWGGLGSSSCAK